MRRSSSAARKLDPDVNGNTRFHSPSGAEVVASGDLHQLAILRDEVFADARKAREDIFTFFEFVMRRIDNNQHIVLAPHQRVGLEFIMAHERSVNMWPVGSSKTFLCAGLTLFMLGQDTTTRGAIVSATEAQARATLVLVRDYIMRSEELRMVFPHLRPTQRNEKWTDDEIVVDRPRGIKDPSVLAVGVESNRILGKRLNWIIIDDLLNDENTHTPEARQKVLYDLDMNVLSRLDPQGKKKVIVVNTPWHSKDVVHELWRERKWATMRMDILGDIEVSDDVSVSTPGHPRFNKPWDSTHLRPATPDPTNEMCRLVAHDPDTRNEVPLWPEKFSVEYIRDLRTQEPIPVFNRTRRCICRDDDTSLCKQEYIDKCLKLARDLGITRLVERYEGPYLTFTGVDLAFSPSEKADETAYFTFEARPNGINVVLDMEIGRWDGPTILEKCFEKHQRYNSIVTVESNAAQILVTQFARQRDRSVPIKPLMTGRAKAHAEYGVPGFFAELDNAAWAFPNQNGVARHPVLERLISDCLDYVPDKHTPDLLMAVYMAREQKRKWVGLTGKTPVGDPNAPGPGTSIMSR